MQNQDISLEFLETFETRGPRYTSYPPATSFSSEYDPGSFLDELKHEAKDGEKPLSLYVHLPFCATLCHFCGCHSIITRDRDRMSRYLEVLEEELRMYGEFLQRPTVNQIHFGGGTPSYLEPDQIRLLVGVIRESFSITSDAEIGLEIDPRTVGDDHLSTFHDVGLNRFSIGVQDLNREVQEAVNRVQDTEQIEHVIQTLQGPSTRSINVDLMYGLPHQDPTSIRETLLRVVDLNVDRLAVYSYAHLPSRFSHQKAIPEASLPGTKERLHLLKTTIETLTGEGYEYIGMDHFARPEDPLCVARREGTLQRNFQGYFTHAGATLLGTGISGIGSTPGHYAQNEKQIDAWMESIRKGEFALDRGYALSDDDQVRREVIMQLMCNLHVSMRRIERAFVPDDFETYFEEALRRLRRYERNELVRIGEDRIQVLPKGRFVIRNIVRTFDCHTRPSKEAFSEESESPYSRTI